ncbi:MAG: hypothetical protein LBQ24_07680 [Candidatus Peribacteria bacterium]|nr:hypothetical protein [Candidatus Peribacteria bacterium]
MFGYILICKFHITPQEFLSSAKTLSRLICKTLQTETIITAIISKITAQFHNCSFRSLEYFFVSFLAIVFAFKDIF